MKACSCLRAAEKRTKERDENGGGRTGMLLVKDNNLIEEEKLERMREINVTLQSPSLQ